VHQSAGSVCDGGGSYNTAFRFEASQCIKAQEVCATAVAPR